MLTPRQDRFCREYIKDLNGTQAAIRAGYRKSSATAAQAARLLTKVKIKERIRKLSEKHTNKLEITTDRILNEIARIAFLDPSDIYDINGDIKPIHVIEEDVRRAIASVTRSTRTSKDGEKTTTVTVKQSDKLRALELLGKYKTLFTDKHELSGSVAVPKTLEDFYGDS